MSMLMPVGIRWTRRRGARLQCESMHYSHDPAPWMVVRLCKHAPFRKKSYRARCKCGCGPPAIGALTVHSARHGPVAPPGQDGLRPGPMHIAKRFSRVNLQDDNLTQHARSRRLNRSTRNQHINGNEMRNSTMVPRLATRLRSANLYPTVPLVLQPMTPLLLPQACPQLSTAQHSSGQHGMRWYPKA